ncbi:MAG TPA: CvpA family protein, partial [Gaiellaceae bacterium]|nr:CvpA family protein [Gaiellaceae bacterium]
MSRADWIALAIAGISALAGLKRGLVATVFSLSGLVIGAVIGARLAPHFLHHGSSSPYTPLAGLAGALVGAALLQSVASVAGSFARGSLSVIPPLRLLDSIGGFIAGAALGLAVVWVAGAVLLQLPGQTKVRDEVRGSLILQQLNSIVPPRTV